MYACNLIRE